MTDTGTDPRPHAKNELRLLRLKVNGKACFAYKWRDKPEASGREVNYVLRDPTTGKDQYLLINCPVRIAGSTELVSVQSTGRSTLVADTIVWESAETVWDDCSTADDCTIRFADPDTLPLYRNVPSIFKQMIREFNEGTRECCDLTRPAPATSELAPLKAAVPQARASETDLKTIAQQAAESAVEPEPAPEYVFRRKGTDFWEIIFQSRALPPVRHLAGMTYLHALLARPGHEISAQDLYEMENPPPPSDGPQSNSAEAAAIAAKYGTGGTTQKVLEGQTPSNLRKAKETLEEKIEDISFTEVERDRFQEQLDAINKVLSASRVAKATGGVTFESKATKQCRQAVSAAIDRSFDALAEQSPSLAKHLRAGAIHKGKTPAYVGGLPWTT